MRAIKLFSLLAAIFFTTLANAANVHVFLLVGQSNMVGRDPTPFSFSVDPRILNFSDGRAGSPLNQIEVANDPLRHDKVGPTYGTNMGRPFARALLPTLPAGDKILFVNRAWGGTPIYEWNKNHGPTGYVPNSSYNLPVNPYNTAINDYKAALEAVKNAGDTPLKAGIIWLQGESDADFLTSPEMFRAATYDVLTLMRQDLDAPNMKVLILEFYQGYAGRAGKLIREQLPLAAKDLGAGFVNSDGSSVRPDGVHLTTASHEKMGVRAAEVYLKLK
jgi:hypothetical protein